MKAVVSALALLDELGADLPTRGDVRVLRDRHLAEMVLDHPEVHHALSVSMMRQLGRAVLDLAEGQESALILRSTGPSFCAGGDLREVRASLLTPERGHGMAQAMTAILDGLRDLPLVSVAVLEGPAIGGGAELCTATDHRWASPSARVHFVHAALGVAPGWGGAGRLVSIVGRGRALRWLSSSLAVEATEALEAGLWDGVSDLPLEAARRFLEPVLARPPEAVRAVKRQVVARDRSDEALAFASVWAGTAHRAALGRLK